MSKRLEMDVWSLDKCSGCGLCVAACSKQMLAWNGGRHPYVIERTKTLGYTRVPLDSCSFCAELCEEVCPRLDNWAEIEPISIVSARARGPIQSGTPNDVIRSILVAGRSAGLLDGVIMLDIDPWELKPVARVVNSVEEIADTIGTQYLWAPVFEALNEAVFKRGMKNLAVVSTPCSVQAIRKLRESDNPRLKPYQDAIRLSVSVFCTGLYKPEMIEEVLVKQMELSRDKVKRLEISADGEWLRAVLWDGSVQSIPRQQAEAFTKEGCGSCDDYLGESADLAVGSLGSLEGSSTLIVRTRVGDLFTRTAQQMNLLDMNQNVDKEALKQAAGEKDKRERAVAFQDLKILMLDALSDPLQHGEAVKQFVRLYRTPETCAAPEQVRKACSGC